jgi:hypothetical protein
MTPIELRRLTPCPSGGAGWTSVFQKGLTPSAGDVSVSNTSRFAEHFEVRGLSEHAERCLEIGILDDVEILPSVHHCEEPLDSPALAVDRVDLVEVLEGSCRGDPRGRGDISERSERDYAELLMTSASAAASCRRAWKFTSRDESRWGDTRGSQTLRNGGAPFARVAAPPTAGFCRDSRGR